VRGRIAHLATHPCPRGRWVRAFKAAGVPCVSSAYLVDWVAHPWTELGPHRLFGTAPGRKLAALEAARRAGGSTASRAEAEAEGARSASF
jgi:hypothetical protein